MTEDDPVYELRRLMLKRSQTRQRDIVLMFVVALGLGALMWVCLAASVGWLVRAIP